MARLQNQVALITGAGQGVGQGIAYALAGEGARIAVIGRTRSKLDVTVAEIQRRGGTAIAVEADIKRAEQLGGAVEQVVAAFGGIDILVNNAQEVPIAPLLALSEDALMAGWESGPLATLRLMKLPDSVKEKLASGAISAGHARALLAVKDPEAAAERIVAKGLNVRDVERLAREDEEGHVRPARPRAEKDADTRALEQALAETTGLEVTISAKPGASNGEVRIRYATLEQLDSLCRALRGG